MKIIVEGAPVSVNKLYATYKGRRLLTKEGKAYKVRLGWLAREAMVNSGAVKMETQAAVMEIRYYFKTRAGDIDNCNKIILDALTGICYTDDKQVHELHCFKFKDAERPRVEIEIGVSEK